MILQVACYKLCSHCQTQRSMWDNKLFAFWIWTFIKSWYLKNRDNNRICLYCRYRDHIHIQNILRVFSPLQIKTSRAHSVCNVHYWSSLCKVICLAVLIEYFIPKNSPKIHLKTLCPVLWWFWPLRHDFTRPQGAYCDVWHWDVSGVFLGSIFWRIPWLKIGGLGPWLFHLQGAGSIPAMSLCA